MKADKITIELAYVRTPDRPKTLTPANYRKNCPSLNRKRANTQGYHQFYTASLVDIGLISTFFFACSTEKKAAGKRCDYDAGLTV